MFDALQWLHILVFGTLTLVGSRRWAFPCGVLCLSALWYEISPWGYYLHDGLVDALVLVILSRGPSRILEQEILLCLSILLQVLSFFEYPTESRLIYDSYDTISSGINLIQLLVVWHGIRDIIYSIVARLDFSLRIGYSSALEISQSSQGVSE